MLAQRITNTRPQQGTVAVFWLGQAGFVFKTAAGTVVLVDPYLSDCCERVRGFKRLMPHMLRPGELTVDLLLVTHAHYDHFDPDSVPFLLAGGAELIAAVDCAPECERLGIPAASARFLRVGDIASARDVKVTAMPCDHGELAPDALALLLEIGGKRVYIAGDTAFRPDYLENPALKNLDLAVLPINGAFGNMNEEQAAEAAGILRPAMTVPCHFWNFAEHGGNPGRFAWGMQAAGLPYALLPMGGLLEV